MQREGATWLLADARGTEPRARLAQVTGRADFLARIPRTLSALQQIERGLESLVDLLVPGLVDLVQVSLAQPDRELLAYGTRGEQPVVRILLRDERAPDTGLQRAMDLESVEHVLVPSAPEAQEQTLRSFLQDELAARARRLRVESLAVFPLTARGQVIGSLTMGRADGLGFDSARPFLQDLADRVAPALDAMLALDQTRRTAHLMTSSLAPDEFHEFSGLASATYFRPAHRTAGVGGDFYALHGSDDDLTLLCGDVAGKGIEAAIMAKRIRNAIRTGSHVKRDPGWLLWLINEVLIDENEPLSGRFATATCLRLRRRPGGDFQVDTATAGHPAPLIVRTDGSVERIVTPGLALGIQSVEHYPTVRHELHARDQLVLFTDGITEARNAAGEEFGDDRLEAEAALLAGVAPEAAVRAIAQAVLDHVGERVHDDLALVAVQPRPERR